MNIFLTELQKNNEFKKLSSYINDNITPILATGVIDTQKTHLIYGTNHSLGKNSVIITHSELKAKEIQKDLSFFLHNQVYLYPSKDIIFYSADVKSTDIIKNRFEVLSRLINGENITVVLSVEALLDRLVPPDIFKEYIIELNSGDTVSIDELTQKLVFMGYERTDMVEGQGQFAVRGGILDLFSTVSSNAVRIEFWGDEIDSIRLLDAYSQRSIDQTDSISIYPMRELVYGEEQLTNAITNISNELKSQRHAPDKLKEVINEALDNLHHQKSFSGVDKYIQYFYEDTVSLLDYISTNTIIYFDEPNRIKEHTEFVMNEFNNSILNRIDKGYMLPSQLNMVFSYEQILNRCDTFPSILLSSLITNIRDFKPKAIVDFEVKGSGVFKNNLNMLVEDLDYMCRRNYRILFLAGGRTRCERLLDELRSNDINSKFIENTEDITLEQSVVYITKGSLLRGFEYTAQKFVVVTDNELFGEEKKKKKSKSKKKKTGAIESFTDLKVGDYIVHDNHGIGVYKGIEQIVTDGISKDYMKLGYSDGGNLYVAINQMDMVQKYIGGDAAKPKLSKLGGVSWVKAKNRAKQAAFILAQDLVDLYAKRESGKGYTYSKDTVWQKEFEESFPYEETDDQLNAIEDVKSDMEQGKIMDRLVCGDVGFGKTEVAIRAAFKTVQDGKQVAYLVPTTILASQHYSTFVSRMSGFPINISLMSRFRTPKEQKETIKGLENGTVDIVIGTHRLLSKDIKFKDIGLVIVDEEQRFGVGHKEKLKELKQSVNVLTLTATPIPRTLHMSMTGIRDMSILAEPPNDRLPIQTYVMEYNPEFVKDAIHRELARGGQVYYLYNRVRNISDVALRLQNLVPEARIGFAHGQMTERELENIMMDFMEQEIDVLVCTTIIETGLDIPNVNTIIIQDADCMGLSQLYQLRGRVGRSTRTSFAYLMYKRDKVLQEVSEKRLQTIKEFTEFGSGFRIAMRDLEIRGAGNLLGAEQHGHMDSVGYEMYCKLLDQAVRELRGEEVIPEFETQVDINVNAFIPPKYIRNEDQKLEMYKKISVISSLEDFYEVQEELEDRYGTMPNSVANLLDIAYLKSVAHNLGAISVIQKRGNVVITFKSDAPIDGEHLMNAVKSSQGSLQLTANGGTPYLTYTLNNPVEVVKETKKMLENI